MYTTAFLLKDFPFKESDGRESTTTSRNTARKPSVNTVLMGAVCYLVLRLPRFIQAPLS